MRDASGRPENWDVGAQIRAFRIAAGLSARELAKGAGISPSAMSQIESGSVLPSLTSLRKIAEALRVPTFKFFLASATPDRNVVRHSDRRLLAVPHSSTSYELITPGLQGELEVMEMRIAPGGSSADEPMGHAGEECLLVLSGRCRVEIDAVSHDLSAGDAVTFRAELPHRTINTGSEDLVAISSISATSF